MNVILNIKFISTIFVISLILSNCSNNINTLINKPPEQIYKIAKEQMYHGNYNKAIKWFLILDNNYPFGSYTHQAQLDLIYAYCKSFELSLAKTNINRFLHLNPIYSKIDYFIYINGLIDIVNDSNILHQLFNIDRSDRDPIHIRTAFKSFNQLIQCYPNSKYLINTIKYSTYLKKRLSKYELFIIEYYYKKKAYVAVINRVKLLLNNFPDTQVIYLALSYMVDSYRQLCLNDISNMISKRLVYLHRISYNCFKN